MGDRSDDWEWKGGVEDEEWGWEEERMGIGEGGEENRTEDKERMGRERREEEGREEKE